MAAVSALVGHRTELPSRLDDVNPIYSSIPIKFPLQTRRSEPTSALIPPLLVSPFPKMYFVEPSHHSHTVNTGLSITDDRYKPTSKQKNAVSGIGEAMIERTQMAYESPQGKCGKRSLGFDAEIRLLVDVLLHRSPRSRHLQQAVYAISGIKAVRRLLCA